MNIMSIKWKRNKPRRIPMIQLINIHSNIHEYHIYKMNGNKSKRKQKMDQISMHIKTHEYYKFKWKLIGKEKCQTWTKEICIIILVTLEMNDKRLKTILNMCQLTMYTNTFESIEYKMNDNMVRIWHMYQTIYTLKPVRLVVVG